MNDTYKFLSALILVYFYFVPAWLFPKIFKKFVKKTFYDVSGSHPDAFKKKETLEYNVQRIISFISFVSIFIGIFLSMIFSNNIKKIFDESNLFQLLIVVLYVFSGILVIFYNLKKVETFLPGKVIIALETSLVVLSFFIIICMI